MLYAQRASHTLHGTRLFSGPATQLLHSILNTKSDTMIKLQSQAHNPLISNIVQASRRNSHYAPVNKVCYLQVHELIDEINMPKCPAHMDFIAKTARSLRSRLTAAIQGRTCVLYTGQRQLASEQLHVLLSLLLDLRTSSQPSWRSSRSDGTCSHGDPTTVSW